MFNLRYPKNDILSTHGALEEAKKEECSSIKTHQKEKILEKKRVFLIFLTFLYIKSFLSQKKMPYKNFYDIFMTFWNFLKRRSF